MPNQPQSNTPALVYVVIGSLQKGGAETHLARVMPGLDRKAFQVKLIELFGRGSLRQTVEKAGLEVYSSPFAIAPTGAPFYVRALRPFKLGRIVLYFASCFWLLTLLLVRRPKILHFFLPTTYVVGAIAGLLVGHNRMLMSRRSRNYYQQSGPIQSWLERKLHPFMARILGNSEAVIADLRQEGVSEKQLGLVYNGIDTQVFQAAQNKQSASRSQHEGRPLLFVKTANLIPYKGHQDLLVALALLDQQQPSWRCWCIGEDRGTLAKLREQAERLGIEDKLEFMGQRGDIAELLVQADVGILASHQEGFSNAVLEYAAAGLPSVVTDVGGNAYAVGEGGIVVPPHDPTALSHALLDLAKSPEKRNLKGAIAKQRVEDLFSLPICIAAYEREYRHILEPREAKP